MKQKLAHTAAIILAAGKGTRMGGTTSKVLRPLLGRPMISYTIENLKNVPIEDIFVVTGYNYESVQSALGRQVKYVHQEEQLGTAHAVSCALYEIPMDIETIVVMNGDDSAFYDSQSISRLLTSHDETGAVITLLTAEVDNPAGLGRIYRENGKVIGIVEEKDASEEQKKISEINTGCYVFDVDWLRASLPSVKKSPSGEYYIVSLLELAIRNNQAVNLQKLEGRKSWWGVNTPTELINSSEIMQKELTKKNQPKLFVLDFDNVLLDTQSLKEQAMTDGFKRFFERNFDQQIAEIQVAKFWELYETVKKEEGWIAVPDLVDKISEKMNLTNIKVPLKRVLFTLPFKKYVFPQVNETIKYLRTLGKVIILSEGDIVYSSAKILGSEVISDPKDIYICEQKIDLYPNILSMYKNYQIYLFDDQIQKLESLAKLGNAKTFWIKNGPYVSQKPINGSFKPDYVINTFSEAENIIRHIE